MRTVSYRLVDLQKATINIGKVGENDYTRVQFDCKRVFDEYPSAVPALSVINPAGTAYPAVTTRDGDFVIWDVQDSDLTVQGVGEFQLSFSDNGTIVKSCIGRTRIDRSIVADGEAPDPVQSWLEDAEEALADIPSTINTALAQAKASGEFDGPPGQDGQDGVSPTVAVASITGGHRVTITDAEGDHPFDVMDGEGGGAQIDDTAGSGDTGKVWSADKTSGEVSALSSAIANEVPQTKPSSSAGADLDVCDESGNVIMRLKDGDVQTKNFNSHDPYRVPDYYHVNNYLTGKCDRFNNLARSCTKLMDTFAFCTDQHWTLNAGKSPALLRYVKEHTNIDKFFFGGDFCDFVTSEHQPFDGFRQFNEALAEPLYTAMGNHDYMSEYGTEGRLYYTFNSVGRDRVGNMERNYFYIDNPQSMIRYIFLNGFKPENNSWGWGYEQDQLDWLANTALDLESGWGAIIVTHVVKGWNFTSEQVEEPAAATAMLSVLDNYSGDGEIIAVICGHTHFDYSTTTTGGIPVLISTCDKYAPWISSGVDKEPWLDDRTAGTIKEQAIDLYIVNREEKKLTRVRVGVPIRYGTDSSLWTEYEDVTISYDRT